MFVSLPLSILSVYQVKPEAIFSRTDEHRANRRVLSASNSQDGVRCAPSLTMWGLGAKRISGPTLLAVLA